MRRCLTRRFAPTAAALVFSILLVSCAARPAVAPKPLTFQEEADATRDWETVAWQIAYDMAARGLLPAQPPASATVESLPFYVNVSGPTSAFLVEVRQSLQSEILRRGGSVSAIPNGAARIDLTSSLVNWPSARRHHDGAPSTEVAWEASITSGDRIVFDVRYPMYVGEADDALYAPPPVGPPTVRLRYAR